MFLENIFFSLTNLGSNWVFYPQFPERIGLK